MPTPADPNRRPRQSTAANLAVGVACGRCEGWNPLGEATCTLCGNDLSLIPAGKSGSEAAVAPLIRALSPPMGFSQVDDKPRSHSVEFVGVSAGPVTKARDGAPGRTAEEPMDQARHYVCESCMTPVPSGHKFCGRCGTPVPEHILHLSAHFYSDMQDPGKARLILIRGEGMDGLSYHLKADQHIVGRAGQLEFPEDPFISPKHANFFYRDSRLVVRDEGSLNGVYFRVRGSVE